MLSDALRKLPVPDPSPEFVNRAIARAVGAPQSSSSRFGALARSVARWETWFGAAIGGAVVATIMLVVLHVQDTGISSAPEVTLALNESRSIDVMIDSERLLAGATIRVFVTGGIELDGLMDEHQLEWRADLDRGPNVLSLPIAARRLGEGRLIAVVEHEGRQRTIEIDLIVKERTVSPT
jgi:hypothetical protein